MREIKKFTAHAAEYKLALNLRYDVLRKPLGLQFTEQELAKDLDDIHFGLFEQGDIVACLTLTEWPARQFKVRQVAVKAGRQGAGLGRQLSMAAEKYAQQQGAEILYCNARKTAVPFYQKMGYETVGGEFTEVGIAHFRMEKKVK